METQATAQRHDGGIAVQIVLAPDLIAIREHLDRAFFGDLVINAVNRLLAEAAE